MKLSTTHSVYRLMKRIVCIALLTGVQLLIGSCASLSGSAPALTPNSPPWPAAIATTCPKRARHIECFKRTEIRQAMHSLRDSFAACSPFASRSENERPRKPLKVTLKIETMGGAPTCIESTPAQHRASQCLAEVIAHHFTIPGSDPDEACALSYPILFKPAIEAP